MTEVGWNTKTAGLAENAKKTLLPNATCLPIRDDSVSTQAPSSTSWLPFSSGGISSDKSSSQQLPAPSKGKCGKDGKGFFAPIPEEVDVDRAEVITSISSNTFGAVHLLRNLLASLVAWFSGGILLEVITGGSEPPLGLTTPELVLICLAGLVLYAWQLYTCGAFWAAVSPTHGGGHAFALRVRALRDAAPLVELCNSKGALERYDIAEWKDETRPAETDCFQGAPRGLFLVTFPLVLIPGDASEVAALEHARATVANANGGDVDSFSEQRIDVKMRLKWLDGAVTGCPEPFVLAEGSAAHQVRPLLLVSAVLLLGLVADLILRLSLQSLEWPVCKRIFTISGGSVGVVRIEISPAGDITLDGDDNALRRANRFWLTDKHWDAVWANAHELGPRVIHLRQIRTHVLCAAAVVAVVSACAGLSLLIWHNYQGPTRCVLVDSAAVLLVIASCAGVLECIITRRLAAWAANLGEQLGSTSACGASWSPAGRPRDTLVLTVEQRAPAGATPNKAYVTCADQGSAFLSANLVERQLSES